MLKERFEDLLTATVKAVKDHYRKRLVTIAVFGIGGTRNPAADSDVDLLLVCEPLPVGRIRRIEEFSAVEEQLAPLLASLEKDGITTSLSVILKPPSEVQQGGLIFLDFTQDARLLYDRGGFFRHYLDNLEDRLRKLGARRIRRGNAWYWDLKPDFKPGERFEI